MVFFESRVLERMVFRRLEKQVFVLGVGSIAVFMVLQDQLQEFFCYLFLSVLFGQVEEFVFKGFSIVWRYILGFVFEFYFCFMWGLFLILCRGFRVIFLQGVWLFFNFLCIERDEQFKVVGFLIILGIWKGKVNVFGI